MNNMVGHKNLALCMMKQFFQDVVYNHIFATNLPIDERFLYSNRGGTYIFPLYCYYEITGEQGEYNFNDSIIKNIEHLLGMKLNRFSSDSTFTGEELLQYIYAILHSMKYRKKYNDQLKYDFPSVPYPADRDYFKRICSLGKELMSLHLPDSYFRTESPVVIDNLQSYKFVGDKVVLNGQIELHAIEGIGDKQLGGYRPADKWLKDRKGSPLTQCDIETYKKILSAIIKTDEIMRRIDEVIIV